MPTWRTTNVVFTGSLSSCKREGFAGERLFHAVHFVKHTARLDQCDPVFRIALTVTHTDFSGLRGNGLVREDTNPHTAAALNVARNGTTSGFDLASRDTTAFKRLQTKFTERNVRATSGETVVRGPSDPCGTCDD